MTLMGKDHAVAGADGGAEDGQREVDVKTQMTTTTRMQRHEVDHQRS